jgi:hypothetical protein
MISGILSLHPLLNALGAEYICLLQKSFHRVMGANARGHTYIAVSTALVVLSTGFRDSTENGLPEHAICQDN